MEIYLKNQIIDCHYGRELFYLLITKAINSSEALTIQIVKLMEWFIDYSIYYRIVSDDRDNSQLWNEAVVVGNLIVLDYLYKLYGNFVHRSVFAITASHGHIHVLEWALPKKYKKFFGGWKHSEFYEVSEMRIEHKLLKRSDFYEVCKLRLEHKLFGSWKHSDFYEVSKLGIEHKHSGVEKWAKKQNWSQNS
jgi:hypothetical protein